jgi:fucose permease
VVARPPVLAFRPMTRSDTSAVLAFVALSAWLLLLLIGWTLGGVVHLLLALALIAFPWRRLGG